MRKDNPPKLNKKELKKFNINDLKDKANIIKDNYSNSKDKNRTPRLDKSADLKSERRKNNSDYKIIWTNPRLMNNRDNHGKNNLFSNNKLILGIICLIIISLTAFIIAENNHKTITNNTTNTTNPININHYDNGIVSFDYPQGWSVMKQQVQSPLIVTVQKDSNNSFSVFSENLGTTSFAYRIAQWRQSVLQSGQITYEGNTTMDGVNGYVIEATYNYTANNTVYNTRGIAIDKNQTVYFLIFTFNTSPLTYKDQMDQVFNSFHVD